MGLCSYEPLVVIVKPGGLFRLLPSCHAADVPQLVESYVRGDDPCLDLALGTVASGGEEAVYIPELDLFKHQERVLLRNCGYNSPLEIDH